MSEKSGKGINIESFYVSLPEAEKEIMRRQKDLTLKKRLEDFWGKNKPVFIDENGPRAVISKSLITPNRELEYFLDVSEHLSLKKGFWEYHSGKFVGKNDERRHLGKIHFIHGRGRNNGTKIDHVNVVDFNHQEGKRLSDVRTFEDDSLVDFHKKILHAAFPEKDLATVDISDWFDRTRHLDSHYYVFYLSLFVRNFILFENFLIDGDEEGKFTLEKFVPSFERVTNLFGVKPLIVPLLPFEHEKSCLWYSYSEKIQEIVSAVRGIATIRRHNKNTTTI